ncbi:MAG: hypothetical protein ABL901_03695 [Hyphomicrobiaceae bacterium]
MRSILGLALLVAVSLGGIEYATKLMPTNAASSTPQMQATLLAPAPPFARESETFGGIIQTVAATQPAPVATQPAPLPPVTVAPQAPRAEPINPIVEPIKRPPPAVKTATKSAPVKAAAAKVKAAKVAGKVKVAKAKPALKKSPAPDAPIVTVIRPGFKLTCTVAQRLDPAKQRCVPAKRPR